MSIRTEAELKAKLEYIIKGSGMSLSDAIKTALFEYCDRYENKNGKIPTDFITSRTADIIKAIKNK